MPIVIADKASANEKKSAAFLKKYLDQSSGATFEIKTEPYTGAAIHIGRTGGFAKLKIGFKSTHRVAGDLGRDDIGADAHIDQLNRYPLKLVD